MKKKVIVIGAGITGMATAAYLAKAGFDVEVYEKNDCIGGRAARFAAEGFTFDQGPQLIFTPEIVKDFFRYCHPSDDLFPKTLRLDPAYRIFNRNCEKSDIPGQSESLESFFRNTIRAGDKKLKSYLRIAEDHYSEIFGNKQYLSDNFAPRSFFRKWFFPSHYRQIKSVFKDYRLVHALQIQYPFMAQPVRNNTSIQYALNFSFHKSGLLYPVGGMHSLVEAMASLLGKMNIPVHTSSPVENYDIIDDRVTGIITHGKNFHADYFVSAMDYRMTEHHLPKEFRNYSDQEWEEKDDSGSLIMYFLGIGKEVKNLAANTIFYNTDIEKSMKKIDMGRFNAGIPVIHVLCPTKINKSLAPQGMETMIIQVIVPSSIEDSGKTREHYYREAIRLIEQCCRENIQDAVSFKKSRAYSDFEADYGSKNGKAFGWMSSRYSMNMRNRKIFNTHLHNLIYAEYPVFTGLGISSSIMAGERIADELIRKVRREED